MRFRQDGPWQREHDALAHFLPRKALQGWFEKAEKRCPTTRTDQIDRSECRVVPIADVGRALPSFRPVVLKGDPGATCAAAPGGRTGRAAAAWDSFPRRERAREVGVRGARFACGAQHERRLFGFPKGRGRAQLGAAGAHGRVKKPPEGERSGTLIQRRGGRRADPHEATSAQRRKLRSLFGRYVRDVRAPEEGEDGGAFAKPLSAVAYALARYMLSDRGRLPATKSGAHDWISTLEQPEDALLGVLRIFDLARRPGDAYSAWRVEALRPLQVLYGYPREGWLDRLNAAISERHRAEEDAAERGRREQQAWAYRANVVDLCIVLPEKDGGDCGGGDADGGTETGEGGAP